LRGEAAVTQAKRYSDVISQVLDKSPVYVLFSPVVQALNPCVQKIVCQAMVERACVKFLSTIFGVALPLPHKLGAIRNETFQKRRHFLEVWHGAQVIGASAGHEISHMCRHFSALSLQTRR